LGTLSFQIGKKPSDMEQELNRTARNGYRLLLLGTAPDGETVELTLHEVTEQPAAEYRVLTAQRTSTMEEELNELAGEGFRLPPSGVFAKPTKMAGIEWAAVMERVPEEQHRYNYAVLTTARESTLRDEISYAQGEGYTVRCRLHSGRGHAAFLERVVEK
jgi:hypothetical protein